MEHLGARHWEEHLEKVFFSCRTRRGSRSCLLLANEETKIPGETAAVSRPKLNWEEVERLNARRLLQKAFLSGLPPTHACVGTVGVNKADGTLGSAPTPSAHRVFCARLGGGAASNPDLGIPLSPLEQHVPTRF